MSLSPFGLLRPPRRPESSHHATIHSAPTGASRRSHCTGCKRFIARLFNPKPLECDDGGRVTFTLHATFAELEICAADHCDLCQFIRREFYYVEEDKSTADQKATYAFSEEVLQKSKELVRVTIYKNGKRNPGDEIGRYFAFGIGKLGGPFFSSDNRYKFGYQALEMNMYLRHENIGDRLALSRRWLEDCISYHKECGLGSREDISFLPTRLLDICSLDSQYVCLWPSAGVKRSKINEYMTLSYRWGPGEHFASTTVDNYRQRLESFPVDSLSRTFGDAIKITRAMGIRYLWIDALCIIQPTAHHEGDWETEFPLMGKIYSHSICTIAASGADHSNGGCFTRRQAAWWPAKTFYLADEDRESGVWSTVTLEPSLPNWQSSVDESPLSERGWVLQEQLLASRTLFWTENGLFWYCSREQASEQESQCQTFRHKSVPLLEGVIKEMDTKNTEGFQLGNAQTRWLDLLQAYSRKDLSHKSDRLPALAGIMNEIARRTGQDYVAGVWQSNMVKELAWGADHTASNEDVSVSPPQARITGVPSWSWGSVDLKLCFRPGRFEEPCDEAVQIDEIIRPQSLLSSRNSNMYRLRIRGNLGRCRVQRTKTRKLLPQGRRPQFPSPCTFELDNSDAVSEQKQDSTGRRRQTKLPGCWNLVLFDTLDDTLSTSTGMITCLKWIEWLSHDLHWRTEEVAIGAIVIAPTGNGENEYRRVGWADIRNPDLFEQEKTTITLV